MLQLFPTPLPAAGRESILCRGRHLWLEERPKVTFYSGPDCASILAVIQPGEQE